ncbi:MAG: mandelate racemase/muconate lactonizing enzyme family protein [Acidimicrobiales bacterium]|jgi:L-alanine-DL-glutamate epimerase-like enolase superfamily enzyme
MGLSADRVDRMEVYSCPLTYAHGAYVMSANRTITTLESTVVVLRTADGVSGYGEVCPLGSTYLPSSAAGARAALRELARGVVGQNATRIGKLHASMDAALAGHGYAKSAVDIAAFDLFGKLCGVPACELLGGRQMTEVPLYVAVPLGPPAEMVDFVLAERAGGIRRFQLKVGTDAETDVARVRAVVEATGEGDTIVADANGGWRLAEAVQAVGMLEGTPRLRIEQPCRSFEECLQVRRRTSLPMVLDEVITDMQALLRATGEQAVEGINLKISRVGGLLPARVIRDVCVELGVALLIEDTWGGDLCSAAVAALAGSTSPSALWAASFMNDWTLEHLAGYQPRSAGGWGPIPDGPGLGIEVDEDQLGELLFEAHAESA